jgi:hypothetical protein
MSGCICLGPAFTYLIHFVHVRFGSSSHIYAFARWCTLLPDQSGSSIEWGDIHNYPRYERSELVSDAALSHDWHI